MAELDYAFLAEYAKVSEGLLTSVGASYTFVRATQLPLQYTLVVAGRVRTTIEHRPRLGFAFESPGAQYNIRVEAEMGTEDARPYGPEGTVGILFVASAPIVLTDFGLYVVTLELDGEHARTLRFEVESGR